MYHYKKIFFGIFAFLSFGCVFLLLPSSASAAVSAPRNYGGTGSSHNPVGNGTILEQEFAGVDFDGDYTLTGLELRAYKVGSPTDNLIVEVYDSNLGISCPYRTGSALATATVSGSTLPTSYDYVVFTFSAPLDVSEDSDLAVRVYRSGASDASNYYRINGEGSDADGAADTRVLCDASAFAMYRFTGDITANPQCVLQSASQGYLANGKTTIYAAATCSGFQPSAAWIGAVRIDPVGSHLAWSEGYGPFPDPYSFDTLDGQPVEATAGRWRVRAYAKDGETLYVSGYMDIDITGVENPYAVLTNTGTPEDWDLGEDDAILSASTTGDDGYYFSASASAIIAAGGLVIGSDGCATISEDATSTGCVSADASTFLFRTFPLLSWPAGIFKAFFNAKEAVDSSPETYSLELPAHGNWIPAVIVVDSASRTKGIGAYIPVSAQDFFKSILTFGLWVAFVYRLRGYANRLI